MKEHEDRYVAAVEKHALDAANTMTLMKHKHRYVRPVKSTRMTIVLRRLSSKPIYKMHGGVGGVGGCEGPGVIYAADLPTAKQLILWREQFIALSKSLLLWV